MSDKVEQGIDGREEWNLDFKEIVDEDLIGVQTYRHRILDKTFEFDYCLDVLWLLMGKITVIITDEKSENLLYNYFGLNSKNTVIYSVSEVYKERMLKAKREARRLKSFGHGIAVDVQLRCLKHFEERSSSDEEISLHELCTKILGLCPPDPPTMPDLSIIDC